MADAKQLIAKGLNEQAKYALQKSAADSELAAAIAKEEQLQADAQRLEDQVQALKTTP